MSKINKKAPLNINKPLFMADLIRLDACPDGKKWFETNFPNGGTPSQVMRELSRGSFTELSYAAWLTYRCFTEEMFLELHKVLKAQGFEGALWGVDSPSGEVSWGTIRMFNTWGGYTVAQDALAVREALTVLERHVRKVQAKTTPKHLLNRFEITMDELLRFDACYEGRIWFERNHLEGKSLRECLEVAVKTWYLNYGFWLLTRSLPRAMCRDFVKRVKPKLAKRGYALHYAFKESQRAKLYSGEINNDWGSMVSCSPHVYLDVAIEMLRERGE